MKKIFDRFAVDIGIDLGTCNTLIWVKDKGIVSQEPSVVAMEIGGSNRIIAVGNDAKKMLWKTPDRICVVRPLRDGVIAQKGVADRMLRYFITKAFPRRLFGKPRMVIGVPACITDVEAAAVQESAEKCGATQVTLVQESRLAAIGANIPIFDPTGNMICDIGGGTTEVAVLSMGDMVISSAIRLGGDEFDEAIVKYVRNTHNMIIGEQTAERLKIEIGSASVDHKNLTQEIRGNDAVTGLPRRLSIDSVEICEALQGPIGAIVEEIKKTLAKTPPELAADIVERGIVMTGGGALLKGLSNLISRETGVPVFVVDDPLTCVAIGAGLFHEAMKKEAASGNVYDIINSL